MSAGSARPGHCLTMQREWFASVSLSAVPYRPASVQAWVLQFQLQF